MGAEKGWYALIVAEEQMPRHTGACLVYVTPKGMAPETVTEFVTDLRIGRFLPTRGFELTAWIHELRTDTS